jgi:hypothetical protein
MRERPILFSAPMVLAILDGRKTQTRRVVKPQPRSDWLGYMMMHSKPGVALLNGPDYPDGPEDEVPCPYGVPGDRLWVKESFRLRADQDHKPPRDDYWKSGAWYEATGNGETPSGCGGGIGRLRSSIHMPRWASRITLEITEVRVQRLQDISEEDARAEGCTGTEPEPVNEGGTIHAWKGRSSAPSPRAHFAYLWGEINGSASWDANPWVWCLSFRRLP